MDNRKIAKKIVNEAITYGMGYPWPDKPPQNPLPICESDLQDRLFEALTSRQKEYEEEIKKSHEYVREHGANYRGEIMDLQNKIAKLEEENNRLKNQNCGLCEQYSRKIELLEEEAKRAEVEIAALNEKLRWEKEEAKKREEDLKVMKSAYRIMLTEMIEKIPSPEWQAVWKLALAAIKGGEKK